VVVSVGVVVSTVVVVVPTVVVVSGIDVVVVVVVVEGGGSPNASAAELVNVVVAIRRPTIWTGTSMVVESRLSDSVSYSIGISADGLSLCRSHGRPIER
jgi:hypothetical protein